MDDRELDRHLRDVPPVADLQARIAGRGFDDASLDRCLRDVPVPAGLPRRLAAPRRSSPIGRPTAPARRRAARAVRSVVRDLLAVAAAFGGIVLVATAGVGLSRTLSAPPRPAVAARSRTTSAPRATRLPARSVERTGASRPIAAARDGGAPAPSVVHQRAAAAPGVESIADAEAAPLAAEALQVRGAAVGLAPDAAVMPRSVPRTPRDAWRRVPRTPGYDLRFELTHGEAPFVDPRAQGLRIDVPPLTVQTDSFDRFVAATPAAARPRTEHVLAAVPPPRAEAASPADPVSLAMHAVRSLRKPDGRATLLVEVAATAAGFPDASPPDALAATIVLDRAAGGEPLVWSWACRAVVAVADRMRPADRITLIVAGPVPRVATRAAAADELRRVAIALETLAVSAGSDLDAALAVARTAEPSTRTVVVAQDGVGDTSGGDTRSALAHWQARAAGESEPRPGPSASTDFVLIDPGTAFEPSRPATAFGRTAADGAAIRRAVLASVFGRDTLVAERGRLTVDFDPGQVLAYRLVGHRQSAVESLSDRAPETIDLHVGETARAVYEVACRSDTLPGVQARFSWTSPDGPRELWTSLRHGADAAATTPSPRGCELLLAVVLGEEASGSPHALPGGRSVASDLIERWRSRGDVTPLGAILADAIASSSRRGAGDRNP